MASTRTDAALAIEREEIERFAKDRDDEQAILDRKRIRPSRGAFGKPPGHRRSEGLSEGHQDYAPPVLDEHPRVAMVVFASPNDKLMTEIEAMRSMVRRVEEGP